MLPKLPLAPFAKRATPKCGRVSKAAMGEMILNYILAKYIKIPVPYGHVQQP